MQNPIGSRVIDVVAVILVLALIAAGVADRDLGWIVLLAVCGGVIAATALIFSRRSGLGASLVRPDPFQDRNSDVIDYSRLRVAGVGGVGLIVVSAAMAMTFPRIGWSVVVSAVAGVALATVWILNRRPHGLSGSR